MVGIRRLRDILPNKLKRHSGRAVNVAGVAALGGAAYALDMPSLPADIMVGSMAVRKLYPHMNRWVHKRKKEMNPEPTVVIKGKPRDR